jgi:omega-amidase
MQDLNVTLVQSDIIWEDVQKNLAGFEQKLKRFDHKPDLVVLPEMFSTGFTMNVEKYAETIDGIALNWMKESAAKLNSVIAGSVLIVDQRKYFNRLFWVKPDGTFGYYNKRHLFSMAGEQLKMAQGQEKKIATLKDWNFNLQICYDLRFPVWSKNNFSKGKFAYDVLVYVANWPEIRRHAYKSLLVARAIENQCYIIWVNRVGYDNNGIFHSGDSMVVDPAGTIIALAKSGREEIIHASLSRQVLDELRNKFKFGQDWDRFTIQM